MNGLNKQTSRHAACLFVFCAELADQLINGKALKYDDANTREIFAPVKPAKRTEVK